MDVLLNAALAGTARIDGAAVVPGTPAEALVAGLPDVGAERRLLLMAGARAVYRRAGLAALALTVGPEPAPVETMPACTPGAAQLIAAMLDGQQVELLPEACALLKEAGLRLPPGLLPAALDAGARSTALRPVLEPVLGARGPWLARFNREWRWLEAVARPFDLTGEATADAATAWEEGTPAARFAALRHVRAENPARGREWLAEVWKAEKAEFRAEAVEAFAVGLSLEDEPFLEAALDDRGGTVRAAAAALLARLPGSALARRLAERADAMLAYDPPGARGPLRALAGALTGSAAEGLRVTLPETSDKSWQRDGIIERPPGQMGERAWWLMQVLAAVPPAHWSGRFGVPPHTLVAAAARDEWGAAVLEGWSRAAIADSDPAWAEALWGYWYRRETQDPRVMAVAHEVAVGLLRCLAPETAERLALRMLAYQDRLDDSLRLNLLVALPAPWSAEVGHRYLAVMRERTGDQRRAQTYDPWVQSLPAAARALPPACFAAALEAWALPDVASWYLHEWRRELDRFVETVQTRQRLQHLIEEIAR